MKKYQSFFIRIFFLLFFFIPHVQQADQRIAELFERICLGQDYNVLEDIQTIRTGKKEVLPEKDWTLMLYISADNDLAPFAIRNIRQMAAVGSNQFFNIVVQLDICKSDGQKVTRRYYIQEDCVYHLNAEDPYSQAMDSGDPETLISFCDWAISNFPARQYGLILWNHGAGILDPVRYRALKAEELFMVNPNTERLEMDRSIGYLDRMLQRGICFDDTTGNYLTNQDLDFALKTICLEMLGNRKIDFVGFDACLMQMVEVGNLLKNYARVMIGSQEAGLGYGWNYVDVLEIFKDGSPELFEFMKHIVAMYKRAYEKITGDYTMSAIDLQAIDSLEKNIHEVSRILMVGLKNQKRGMVKNAVKAARSKLVCTHFDEPSYIDLHHFYGNLLANLGYMQLEDDAQQEKFKRKLEELLKQGRSIIEEVVFANTSGQSLSNARGISIYFPERKIHSSYSETFFSQQTDWLMFLVQQLIS